MSLDTGGLPQAEVDELVDERIEDGGVVLFMKGTSVMPQCGYSEKALHLLRKHCGTIETIDVLASPEEFRTALERHSGWTTIPQAYVDGEFIGGSDVLEELEQRGELESTVIS